MTAIALFIGLALCIASVAVFLVWRHPGSRDTSEKIAETGLIMIVPLFGAIISLALSYDSNKGRSKPDADPTASLAGAAGGASSVID